MKTNRKRIYLAESKHNDHHFLGVTQPSAVSSDKAPLSRRIFNKGVRMSRKISKFYLSFKIATNQDNYS